MHLRQLAAAWRQRRWDKSRVTTPVLSSPSFPHVPDKEMEGRRTPCFIFWEFVFPIFASVLCLFLFFHSFYFSLWKMNEATVGVSVVWFKSNKKENTVQTAQHNTRMCRYKQRSRYKTDTCSDNTRCSEMQTNSGQGRWPLPPSLLFVSQSISTDSREQLPFQTCQNATGFVCACDYYATDSFLRTKKKGWCLSKQHKW